MFQTVYQLANSVAKYRDYRPQPVTPGAFYNWIRQFDCRDRKNVLRLLSKVIYFSENDTRNALVQCNRALLKDLEKNGLSIDNVVYVSIGDAGSSSPVMLNLLRDAERLEKRGCRLVDANNHMGLFDALRDLQHGAVVYVDDFTGTGHQFCAARDAIAQQIVGTNFSEFLLVPAICEEAYLLLGERGITPHSTIVHAKVDRPLHLSSEFFDFEIKARLTGLCREIDSLQSLGYEDLATMVVYYLNAPDSLPRILRGGGTVRRWVGLFPRANDLPVQQQP